MSEIEVFQGVEYRRYPKSKTKAHRYYFRKGYRVNGKYFEVYLHVAMWKSLRGALPKGWVVHHKDFNHLNNSIDNLEAMDAKDHLELHKAAGPKRILPCFFCSKEFSTAVNRQKYCSHSCQQKWHYHQNKKR